MSARSRLKVGVDVPWVTSWSGEAQLAPAPCASVDGEIAIGQASRPGEGRPLYSMNHLFRQRCSVRSMLCPMCGEATQAGDRWTQTGRPTTAGALRAQGFAQWLPADLADDRALLACGSIAPLHRACAEAALARCPHLGGMAEKTLRPFPETWFVFPLTAEAKPRGAPGPGVPVVAFMQIVGIEP